MPAELTEEDIFMIRFLTTRISSPRTLVLGEGIAQNPVDFEETRQKRERLSKTIAGY